MIIRHFVKAKHHYRWWSTARTRTHSSKSREESILLRVIDSRWERKKKKKQKFLFIYQRLASSKRKICDDTDSKNQNSKERGNCHVMSRQWLKIKSLISIRSSDLIMQNFFTRDSLLRISRINSTRIVVSLYTSWLHSLRARSTSSYHTIVNQSHKMQKIFVLKIEHHFLMSDTIIIEFIKIFETSHSRMSVDVVDNTLRTLYIKIFRKNHGIF